MARAEALALRTTSRARRTRTSNDQRITASGLSAHPWPHPEDRLDDPVRARQSRTGAPPLHGLVPVPDLADVRRFVPVAHRIRIGEPQTAAQPLDVARRTRQEQPSAL